jgi:hypothetical protein
MKTEPRDWRTILASDEDVDDEELPTTPKDVVEVLGFDPLEDDEDDEKEQ